MTESTSSVAADPPSPAARSALPRRLGVLSLTFLLIAFNAPIAAMAGFQQLVVGFGNGIGAPGAFVIAGGVLLLFAVGFVAMSKHSPNPGAYYRYVVDGLGRSAGLAGAFVAMAAYLLLGAGALPYLGLIVTDMTTRLFGEPVLNWQWWSLIGLVLLALLAILRIDLSMRLLGALVVAEIVVVAVWELVVFVQGGPEGHSPESWAPAHVFSGSPGLAILFAMLTMSGIEACACFRDEAVDPDRSVARATFLGVGTLTVLYALGSWAYIITQGPSKVVDSALNDPVGSFFNSIEQYLGSVFLHIVTIVLVTSQIAAMNTAFGMCSRYFYAMGRDRVLPRQLARVHPRLQSPHIAVSVVMGLSLIMLAAVVASGVDEVQAYAGLTGAGIYLLLPLLAATSISVIIYFRRHPDRSPGPWRAVVAPALAALALIILFVLTTRNLAILVATDRNALIAQVLVAVVPIGGFLLAVYFRRNRPDIYRRIGNPF